MAGGIPDRVGRFIGEHISSVEGLEVLLLLHGEPERWWRADEIGAELKSVPESVSLRLADLREHDLVEANADGAHRVSRAVDAAAVDELRESYRRRRVAVIAAIFAEPGDDPAQDFADAFRLRKDAD